MPADYDEFFTAFADLVGTADEQDIYPNADYAVGNVDVWIDLFAETGIDFDSHDQTIDAFENFIIAFYPQEGKTADEWFYDREEFYYQYGIGPEDIDWEAYREAIGYGRD